MHQLVERIKEMDFIYGHIKEEGEPELLLDHLNRSSKYFHKISKAKKLESVWQGFKKTLGNYEDFEELLEATIYLHDIGKTNRNFQINKMKNEKLGKRCNSYTNHALLSALLYLDYYLPIGKKKGLKGEEIGCYCMLLMANGYVISRHHAGLSSLLEFEEALKKLLDTLEEDKALLMCLEPPLSISNNDIKGLYKNAQEYINTHFKAWEESVPYIYSKFVYSVLVACDFYATSEYMKGEAIEEFGVIEDYKTWMEAYQQTDLFRAINTYKQTKRANGEPAMQINDLRSNLFWEATETLEAEEQERICYLEAPTGSGKTNTSIWLALKFLEREKQLNQIFYVFPFNALAEQTSHALNSTFNEQSDLQAQMAVVNSATPIKDTKDEQEGEKLDYERMLLDRQFLHYPLVITSHVQLFNLFFGASRGKGSGLYRLANSVIILDEIQSYKNILWTEIIGFLNSFSRLLNCKVLIMSATLPRIGQLVSDCPITTLIKNRDQYFQNPLFKERVILDFSLLDVEADLVKAKLIEMILKEIGAGKQKLFAEFIKKKSATQFYNELLDMQEAGLLSMPIRLLTGDDSKWEREKCIREVKESSQILLIATQLIEAGVDIDMDVGFKDISLLDAEEQFLGRINRSCLKQGCKAYFFNLDEATSIYKEDYRKQKQFTLVEEINRQTLENKQFDSFYDKVMVEVNKHVNKENAENLESFLKDSVAGLVSQKVEKRMRLIDEELYPITVFLARVIEVEREGKTCLIDGRLVWEEYKNLLTNKHLSYAERKVKLSKHRELMDAFIYKVKKFHMSHEDRIGDTYYIEEGEAYFTNGKFDREKLTESSYELI